MTKFNEFDDQKKEILKEIMILELENKVKDDREYIGHIMRFLIISNGSGIILLATFMGAIAASGHPISQLVSPLWKFLFGAIIGSLIYGILAIVANQALNFHSEQAIRFIKNEIDLEEKQNWGLTKRGIISCWVLMSISFILFLWGVYNCISILSSL
ncbi:hypothetical protein [Nitrosomonas sp. wSCUT-2]